MSKIMRRVFCHKRNSQKGILTPKNCDKGIFPLKKFTIVFVQKNNCENCTLLMILSKKVGIDALSQAALAARVLPLEVET